MPKHEKVVTIELRMETRDTVSDEIVRRHMVEVMRDAMERCRTADECVGTMPDEEASCLRVKVRTARILS